MRNSQKERTTIQRAQEGRSAPICGAIAPVLGTEHEEQAALFQWAALYAARVPELALLHAIPNGGHRHIAVAMRLRAEGVKPGVPDVFMPCARHGYHGCYIEMKAGKGRPTKEQRWWGERLREQGYQWHVCYGWQIAAYVLICYLGLDAADFGLGGLPC